MDTPSRCTAVAALPAHPFLGQWDCKAPAMGRPTQGCWPKRGLGGCEGFPLKCLVELAEVQEGYCQNDIAKGAQGLWHEYCRQLGRLTMERTKVVLTLCLSSIWKMDE